MAAPPVNGPVPPSLKLAGDTGGVSVLTLLLGLTLVLDGGVSGEVQATKVKASNIIANNRQIFFILHIPSFNSLLF
jgi:hypothetical protein